eukprot:7915800-Pyramimonas_sp.AAC.1
MGDASVHGQGTWSESLAVEEAKQHKKNRAAAADALLDGVLLPSEITFDLMDEAAGRQSTKQANDRKRARTKATLAETLAKPGVGLALAGARVCNRAGALSAGIPNTMAFVNDPLQCEILVVRDPSALAEMDAFALALNGGLAVSREYLASGGQRGP